MQANRTRSAPVCKKCWFFLVKRTDAQYGGRCKKVVVVNINQHEWASWEK
jgi:hypothetical protein